MSANHHPFEAELENLEIVVRRLIFAGHSPEAAVEQAIGYATEHLKSLLPKAVEVAAEVTARVAAPVVATPAAVVAPQAEAK